MVASPGNAVLALGASTLLPPTRPLGAVFLAMLVMARDVKAASVLAALAAGTLVLFATLVGNEPLLVAQVVLVSWLPAYVLAVVWQRSRSLLLTLQLSLLAAIGVLLVFHVAVSDIDAFWEPVFKVLDDGYRQQGLTSPVAVLREGLAPLPDSLAVLMTTSVITMYWLLSIVEIGFGGALYNALPGERRVFGRMRDLDFGRVLAGLFAVVLVLAFATGSSLLRQIGLLMTFAFVVQGIVVAHWLHLERRAPAWLVVATYGSLLVLMQYAVVAIAVIGYLDAWFRIRHRIQIGKGLKS